MKKFQFLSLLAIATLALLAGCDAKKTDPAPNAGGSGSHVHDDGTVHDRHAEEGHSHGEGPHGGVIADWGGGKFHVEFTVDHDQQLATVYILGDDEKTASPIDPEEVTLSIKDPAVTVTLKASPQDGDPEGKASRYVGNHESLGVVKEYEGSISGAVGGTPYSGNFKEEAHDH